MTNNFKNSMEITQTGLIAIVAIIGLTLIGLTALTINSDGAVTIKKDDGFLVIEGKRSSPKPQKMTDGCSSLAQEENSRRLDCI